MGRFHTFFGTFRGTFRAERFLACARFRSGLRIQVWFSFRLWLRFRFRARFFYLLWLFWRLLRRNDLRLCRPSDLYFALELRWTLGKWLLGALLARAAETVFCSGLHVHFRLG